MSYPTRSKLGGSPTKGQLTLYPLDTASGVRFILPTVLFANEKHIISRILDSSPHRATSDL